MSWLLLFLLNAVALVLTPFVVGVYVLLGLSIPWWMNTPDDPDPLKQGLYEPAVASILAKYGQKVKTWYWLGIRNQLNGLFWYLAPIAPAGAVRTYTTPAYPKTKDPYTPGVCSVRMTVNGATYWEWNAVWAWSATKCAQIRLGYKLAEMDLPGPVVFCFQIRPWLTINSTT